MTLSLETTKLKRTGYIPTFIGGAVVASAFPLLDMLVRSETFIALSGNPFQILLDSNWQMMALLNILLLICGSCMMYHTEYADNGTQKMNVLPIRGGSMFFGKFIITVLALAGMLILETATLAVCCLHWFPYYELDMMELIKSAGFSLVVSLPTIMLMLLVASACKNMWVSLGIGVVLAFTLSIFPKDNLFFNLCPFSSPYQTLYMSPENGTAWGFLAICLGETVLFGIAEVLYNKLRRCFS